MGKHFKSTPTFSKSISANVDTTNGVIKNVVIIQGGQDKVGDNFDTKALSQIVFLGNSQEQGVKSRFGHPNACSDALGTYIGRYKNFSLSKNADGLDVVTADLYLDPIAKKSPKGNLYQYTLDMALSNADMFGNSIVYQRDKPKTVKALDANGNEIEKTYERVKALLASDVVDSPAATTNLFKSENDFAAIATQFLDENEELFEHLYKNQNIVTEFLTRYKAYKKEKEDMSTKSFTDKLKSAINSVVAEFQKSEEVNKEPLTITLTDGSVITITDDNGDGVASVGDKVMDSEGAPIVSQTLVLPDGSEITTDENGVITEMSTADAGEEPAPVMESEDAKSVQALQAEIARLKSEHEAELENVLAEVEKLKETLSSVKSSGNVPVGTQNFKAPNKKSDDNAVIEARERMKSKK